MNSPYSDGPLSRVASAGSSLTTIPASILSLDESENLVEWSDLAAEQFELTNQHRGKPWSLIVSRAFRPHAERAIRIARQQGQWVGDLTLQTTNGEEMRSEMRIRDGSRTGQRGLIVGVTNLSSRLEQEKEFRQEWQRRTAERIARAAAAELRAATPREPLAQQFESLALAPETVEEGMETTTHGSLLIVGGGPLGRECLRLQLEASGFTVSTAAASFEAVEQLNADKLGVRAAIVDAELPGWGAAAAITALRQQDPFLPIVLLGNAEGKRITAEVQVVVPKPYRLDDVLWAINECRHATV